MKEETNLLSILRENLVGNKFVIGETYFGEVTNVSTIIKRGKDQILLSFKKKPQCVITLETKFRLVIIKENK